MRRLGLSGIRSGWMRGVFRAHFLPFSVQILRLRVAEHRELQCGMAEWQERITINPAVCHGKACIRGTRVMVPATLDNLAVGVPREEIIGSYPSIRELDIQASLAYPAELAREGTADLPLEHTV